MKLRYFLILVALMAWWAGDGRTQTPKPGGGGTSSSGGITGNSCPTNQVPISIGNTGTLSCVTLTSAYTDSSILKASNNLSDLITPATARTNLGLGAAALLGSPIPEANGGTGANNIVGSAGHGLRSNGSHYVDAAFASADLSDYGSIPNAALANVDITVSGQTCTLGSTCTVPSKPPINAAFDGGSSTPTVGKTVYTTYTGSAGCTIAAWNIIATPAGSATIDIWKVATGTAVPTVSNTITAGALPAIASGTAIHSTSMNSWILNVSHNDIFAFYLSAVSTSTYVQINLECN